MHGERPAHVAGPLPVVAPVRKIEIEVGLGQTRAEVAVDAVLLAARHMAGPHAVAELALARQHAGHLGLIEVLVRRPDHRRTGDRPLTALAPQRDRQRQHQRGARLRHRCQPPVQIIGGPSHTADLLPLEGEVQAHAIAPQGRIPELQLRDAAAVMVEGLGQAGEIERAQAPQFLAEREIDARVLLIAGGTGQRRESGTPHLALADHVGQFAVTGRGVAIAGDGELRAGDIEGP